MAYPGKDDQSIIRSEVSSYPYPRVHSCCQRRGGYEHEDASHDIDRWSPLFTRTLIVSWWPQGYHLQRQVPEHRDMRDTTVRKSEGESSGEPQALSIRPNQSEGLVPMRLRGWLKSGSNLKKQKCR